MKIFMDTKGNAEHYHETAYFGWQDELKALIGTSIGYKNAADKLIDLILEDKDITIKDRDTLIFPILFCYRHSVESLLKLIYMRVYRRVCKGKHDLSTIWRFICSDVIDGCLCNKDTIDELMRTNANFKPIDKKMISSSKIKEMLDELQNAGRDECEKLEHDKADTQADIWRYLISPDGELYFSKGHWIHYPTLKVAINELYEMLDYLYMVVDEFLSA